MFMTEFKAVAQNDSLRDQVRGLMKEKQKGIYEEVRSRDSALLRYEAAAAATLEGKSTSTPLRKDRQKVA